MADTATTPAFRPAPLGLFLAAIILAFAGLVLCNLILAQQNAGNLSATGGFMCGGDGQGCLRVYNSPEGKFLELPSATWGLAYFLGAALFLLAAGRRAAAHWFTFIPLTLGGLYSLWMLVQLLRLGEFCGWCVTTHVINFLMIGAIVASAAVIGRCAEPNIWRVRILGLILPVTLLVGFSLGMIMAGQNLKTIMDQQALMNDQVVRLMTDEDVQTVKFRKTPAVNLVLAEDDAVLGPRDAAVRITVFKDFQCPHCQELSERIRKVLARFPKEACLVFKHYPQDNPCNPHRRDMAKTNPGYARSAHPFACETSLAAEAVRVAGGNEAFWKYHDLLYENQGKLYQGRALLRELAAKVGVSGEKFDEQMKNDRNLREKINRDCLLYQQVVPANDLAMGAIPRVYLNGRYFDVGWKVPNEYFERTVQALLQGELAASQPTSGTAH